nr:2OG-Fe(II) oxygenase [uncultured Roseateles sp.]
MSLTSEAVPAWVARGNDRLTGDSLNALLSNEIPFIRVPDFGDVGECELLLAAAARRGFGAYRNVEPRIDRIGNTVFEFNDLSRAEYFERNRELIVAQAQIFAASFNPLHRLLALLWSRAGRRAELARNDRGEPYYAGLIRRIEAGTQVHVDFAPGEQPGWEVGRVTHQLSWNLYLRAPLGQGGRTHIFHRQWDPSCNVYKSGSYGYDPLVVEGVASASFQPRPGELVLFNTRNFHFVEPSEGDRVTVTSAIGRLPDGGLILWS